MKKAMLAQGIKPKMSFENGELEIKVNGQRVYSHTEEGPLPADAVLLQRIQSALAK